MNITNRHLCGLGIILAGLVAGCVGMGLTGKDASEETKEKQIYLTAYTDPEQLLAVEVTNRTGDITVAYANQMYYIDYRVDGVTANVRRVSELLVQSCALPLEKEIEGAAADDAQYGLTDPQAQVLIEDTQEKGTMFQIGSQTPSGDSYYVGVTGSQEVYTMKAETAEMFLGRVTQFLDLSLFPEYEDAYPAQVQLTRGDETVFRMKQSGEGQTGSIPYYQLEEPCTLPISVSNSQAQMIGYLADASGLDIVDGDAAAYGLDEPDAELTLTGADESQYTVEFKNGGDNTVYAMREGENVIYTVSKETVAFIDSKASDLLGGRLFDLNMNSLSRIELEAGGKTVSYEISGSGDGMKITVNGEETDRTGFRNSVIEPLNDITLREEDSGEALKGEPILTCRISMKKMTESVEVSFFDAGDRKCRIAVDGNSVFVGDLSAVEALMAALAD